MPLRKSIDTESRSPGDARSGVPGTRDMFVPSGFMNFFLFELRNAVAVVVPYFRRSNQKLLSGISERLFE
jgi:hypothetical protein